MMDETERGSSTCIMLVPDESYRSRRPGATEHHLTVAYFGHFPEGAMEPARLRQALPNIAKNIGGKIPAVANATGLFPDRDKYALVDLIDGIGTFYARKILESMFGMASGGYDTAEVKIDYTHGFTPHITRAYVTADQVAQQPTLTLPGAPFEFTFESIGVWHGEYHYEVAL